MPPLPVDPPRRAARRFAPALRAAVLAAARTVLAVPGTIRTRFEGLAASGTPSRFGPPTWADTRIPVPESGRRIRIRIGR